MNAYSVNLRSRIVHCFDSGQDIGDVAGRFGVSAPPSGVTSSTSHDTGGFAPKKHPGRRPKLSEEQLVGLREEFA